MDGTLTPSRAPMLPEHTELFTRLCESRDVVIVTGQEIEQIQRQVLIPQKGNYFLLSQQGNYAFHKDGHELWKEMVTKDQEPFVKKVALAMTKDFLDSEGLPMPVETELFENRGSQFASSVLGFHAPNEQKYAIDPDQSKRRALLEKYATDIEALKEIGIEAMPAGTTTIDFILTGKNKGHNIERLIESESWNKSDCVYIGDALFPGGNDEAVIGVIDTKSVANPHETAEVIKDILGVS